MFFEKPLLESAVSCFIQEKCVHIPFICLARFLVFRVEKRLRQLGPFFWSCDAGLNVEDVFCSEARMKILKLLFRYGQLNPSAIARELRTNYEFILNHLELLEGEGIVLHKVSGRVRFFRFANSPKAQATVKLLESWE